MIPAKIKTFFLQSSIFCLQSSSLLSPKSHSVTFNLQVCSILSPSFQSSICHIPFYTLQSSNLLSPKSHSTTFYPQICSISSPTFQSSIFHFPVYFLQSSGFLSPISGLISFNLYMSSCKLPFCNILSSGLLYLRFYLQNGMFYLPVCSSQTSISDVQHLFFNI